MIPGRDLSLKALVAGSLFINGLAIGICALYLSSPATNADSAKMANDVPVQAVDAGKVESNERKRLEREKIEGGQIEDGEVAGDEAAANAFAASDTENDSILSSSANGKTVSLNEKSQAKLPNEFPKTTKNARLLENADAISNGGDFSQSLRIYQRIRTLDEEYRRYEIAARIAFCHEALGQSKQALLLYQAIAEQSNNPRLVAACQIGFARTTLNRGEPKVASRLLRKMYLNGDLFQMQDVFSAELMFLLAESELRQYEAINQRKPGSLDRIASTGINASPTDSFRLLTGIDSQSNSEQTTSGANLNQGSHSIEQVAYTIDATESKTETILVPSTETTLQIEINPQLKTASMVADGTTKLQLITALAENTGLSLSISPAARDQLVTEYQDASKKSVKIDMALDAILLSSDMLWNTQEQTLQISLASENADFQSTSQLAALERILRHCIIYFPGHDRATLARTALANVTFWQGNPSVAIGHYGNLLREREIKRLFPVIRFNMGVCCLKMLDHSQAEHHFQNVIDNSLNGTVLGEAHIHKGILEIESGRNKGAVRTFSRGVSTSIDSKAKSLACLGLAASYIESENPHAAVITIERASSLFKGKDLESAVFLVSFAKFRIKGREISEPSRHLLSACSRFEPQSLPGLIGYKLLADAYEELNFQDAKLVTLQSTLETNFASSLRRPLLLELARCYSNNGQTEQAAMILQSIQPVAASSPSTANAQDEIDSMIELARVHCQAKRFDDALESCRRAIQLDRELAHKDVLLGLLGKIYQAQGNNLSAAMCFAGLMPTFTDEIPESVPVTEQ